MFDSAINMEDFVKSGDTSSSSFKLHPKEIINNAINEHFNKK